MNRRKSILSLAGIFFMVTAGAQVDQKATAIRLLTLVSQQKWADATAMFDGPMKAALPAEKLASVWQSLGAQFGAYVGLGEPVHRRHGEFDAYSIPCKFERAAFECRVTLNGSGKVAGFFVAPGAASPPSPLPGESAVVVGKEPYALPGTLTLPDKGGPFPAVVLVHGSGPHDRDETIGPNKPFRDLAEGLRSHGVAVLRYEKRTYRHKASMPEKITLSEETIYDAVLAVEELARRSAIDKKRIFVLGHSLGGMVAARIAARAPVAGIVAMATPTRPFLEVFRSQLAYIGGLPESATPDAKKQIEFTLEQLKRLEDSAGDDGEKILGAPRVYWRDLLACQPAKELAEYRGRVLILQGERDYQVTMEDFAGWKKALGSRPGVEMKSYPGLNHLFIDGAGKSTPADTMRPGRVSATVIGDIARWIAGP